MKNRKRELPQPKGALQHVDNVRKWRAHGRSRSPHPQYHELQGLERSPLEFCQCCNNINNNTIPDQHTYSVCLSCTEIYYYY